MARLLGLVPVLAALAMLGAGVSRAAPAAASRSMLELPRLALEQLDAVEPAPEEAPEVLALANPFVRPEQIAVRVSGGSSQPKAPRRSSPSRRSRRSQGLALTPERAQALLRSVTVPGWGQATLGHPTAGAVFGVIESGIWGSFTAFRIQEHLRREGAARTARIYAGVDLRGRDEEFLRLVGAFASSDEYNLLVVARDAANLYYDQPDQYRDYIAIHSLKGADRWAWQNEASFLRYRAQRKDAQRAGLRSNTALALAVGNRILSVLHAARVAGRPKADAAPRSWRLEVRPSGGDDPTAYRIALGTRF